ncbi:hypothetical protein SAMN04487972_106122 [Paracoccus halophilus]|uniref:NnrT protein n=1 Tax=Paracoccus halophilus TaxID=376733 RepID=A0A099F550_9RHOB|nr:hypothetical protein [Paracoccus halophilus]KGJ05403.1 hypothetical protein IT41_06460 [Paracoccus halophilus]SFA49060.1 hypothetical protein SAMN04487972_106122 [Paracoccus halophilus]
MSGTRSPSKTEPATEGWPVWKLALLFYPFAAAAVWINLFMLSLLASWLGFAVWSPYRAAAFAVVLGIPATWAAGRWIRGLMDQAAPPDRS